MSNGPQNTPPGWYNDGSGAQRYWDGTTWTQHTQPSVPSTQPPGPAAPQASGGFPGAAPAPQHGKPAKKGLGTGAKIGLGVGGLLMVGVIGAAVGGAGSDGTVTTTDGAGAGTTSSTSAASSTSRPSKPKTVKPSTSKAAAVPGIGSTVKDGKFTFVVTKVVPGKTKVGDQYLNKKSQGQFVLVYVTVTNHGDEAQSFFGDNQVVYDAQGRKFSADSEAAIYLGDASKSLYEEINPGNSVKGIVVFDVPKGVKLTKIELHDSAFSGGVDVKLG